MPRPEAVIFDIGNVLVEWQPERYFDRLIGAAAREAMFRAVDLHAMNDRIDRGGDFAAIVEETAASHPEHAAAIRHWHRNWIELASPEIALSAHLARALRRAGVPIFILSNIGHETFNIARARYPVLGEFDRAFLSARIGALKPEPEIYAHLEADCGLAPGALLFTDDRAENIEAAARRGWQVHHFETPEGWARALVEAGLLSEAEARP